MWAVKERCCFWDLKTQVRELQNISLPSQLNSCQWSVTWRIPQLSHVLKWMQLLLLVHSFCSWCLLSLLWCIFSGSWVSRTWNCDGKGLFLSSSCRGLDEGGLRCVCSSLGVCLWGSSCPLGYSQVSFVSQSKAGHAEKTQETSAGDGQKNSNRKTFCWDGQKGTWERSFI